MKKNKVQEEIKKEALIQTREEALALMNENPTETNVTKFQNLVPLNPTPTKMGSYRLVISK